MEAYHAKSTPAPTPTAAAWSKQGRRQERRRRPASRSTRARRRPPSSPRRAPRRPTRRRRRRRMVRAGDDDGADDGPAVALPGSFYWEASPRCGWPLGAARGRAAAAAAAAAAARAAVGARPHLALPQADGGARRRAAGGARGRRGAAGKLAVAGCRWWRGGGGDRGGEPKPEEAPALRELALSLPTGQLAMVAGPVGSGKSSALTALLGEMRALNGATATLVERGGVRRADSVHHERLAAWQLASSAARWTIRSRYQKTLKACALLPDLALLSPPATPPRSARRASTSGRPEGARRPRHAPCTTGGRLPARRPSLGRRRSRRPPPLRPCAGAAQLLGATSASSSPTRRSGSPPTR